MNLLIHQRHTLLQRASLNLSFMIIMLLLATGCFGGGGDESVDPNQANESAEQQPVQRIVTCSEACANYGQCGQADDGNSFVLARIDRPNTRNHDLLLPDNEPIDVIISEQRTIQLANNEQTLQAFSFVSAPNLNKTGWVSDWCIAQP